MSQPVLLQMPFCFQLLPIECSTPPGSHSHFFFPSMDSEVGSCPPPVQAGGGGMTQFRSPWMGRKTEKDLCERVWGCSLSDSEF